MVSQRGRVMSRLPEISQDGGDDSMSSNLTPLQTNARGRPPLPMRQAKPNRLPPTPSAPLTPTDSRALPPPPLLPTLSRQRPSSLHQHVSMPSLLDASTESTETVSPSSSRSVASAVQNRRISVRDGGEHWRSQGKIFRAKLLMKDEEMGGNFFVLSNECDIERYYEVADKVLDQFLSTSIDECTELTESYLIGNRLIKFLSTVLPTHKDYLNPNLSALRSNSQGQLVQLLQYMEQLALIIDEEELNRFILSDLTKGEDVDSSPSVGNNKKTLTPQKPRNRDNKSTPTGRRTSTVQNDNDDDDEPEPDVSFSTLNTSMDSASRADSKSASGGSAVWTMAEKAAAVAQHRAPNQSQRSKNRTIAAHLLDLEPQNDASFDESRDLSRVLSGEFDNLVGRKRDDAKKAEWEAHFSDFGIQRKSSGQVARTNPVDQRADVEEVNKDDFVLLREQSQKEPRNAVQQRKQANEAGSSPNLGIQSRSTAQLGKQVGSISKPGKPIGSTPQQGKQTGSKSPQQKEEGASTSPQGSQSGSTSSPSKQDGLMTPQPKPVVSIPQQPKKPTASMEWSTNFHNRDPFQFVLKQKVESSPTSIPAVATGIDETWKPEFPTFATPVKKQKKKVSFSSADASVSINSQTTPPEAHTPSRRKSSPTSVQDLYDWHSCYDNFDGVDEMKHIIQVDRPSDDCSSLGSHEEREHSTRALRRRTKNPFKGCVKCFLD